MTKKYQNLNCEELSNICDVLEDQTVSLENIREYMNENFTYSTNNLPYTKDLEQQNGSIHIGSSEELNHQVNILDQAETVQGNLPIEEKKIIPEKKHGFLFSNFNKKVKNIKKID